MATSLEISKKRSRSINCTQNAFIWLKIGKSVQWILRQLLSEKSFKKEKKKKKKKT